MRFHHHQPDAPVDGLRRLIGLALFCIVSSSSLADLPGGDTPGAEPTAAANVANAHQLAPLPRQTPSPSTNPTTPEKVALGKQLFFDPRLSGDNTMSCASCHQPHKAFADALPVGRGHQDKPLTRNTSSCLHVGWFAHLFWDGRATTLEEQALIPIQAAEEMNQPLDELEAELLAIPAYVRQFKAVFDAPPSRQHVGKALAAFQRTLNTAAAPFDLYLRGDEAALSEQAKQGLELFRGRAGCLSCHHGPLLSDHKFYRLGVSHRDAGRFQITGNADDRFRFRTPSLRNVAMTAPYMHNGSLKTLDEVVTFYYRGIPDSGPYGLRPDAEPLLQESFSDIPLLVAFLESLTGEVPTCLPPPLPAVLPGEPETFISTSYLDEHGLLVHRIESPLQSEQTDLRVLLPKNLNAIRRVVFVLPVEPGREDRYGDGLLEVKQQDLHNQHKALFVAPSFAELPWYADHPTDRRRAQETYLLRIVLPFVEQTYGASQRATDRLLLGFSKSGWGAWSLLLRHPATFGKAVAWDAPLMMRVAGEYGSGSLFADDENFRSYQIRQLLRSQSAHLAGAPRLILTGYGNFRQHHQEAVTLLQELSIPHIYRDGPPRKHDWHSGWVAEAVALLLHDKAAK